MDWLPFLILLAVEGLIVGAFARLALPGKDPLSLLQTMAVGLAGTFIAGIVVYAATDGSAGPGFIVALFFAVIIMYFIRRSRGGGLMDPGTPGGRREGPGV